MIDFCVILGLISLILILFGVIVFTICLTRFNKGDFRNFFTYVLMALYFMAIPYTLFIIRDLSFVETYHSQISYVIYVFMIFVSLLILKASFGMKKFSDKYGFRVKK